jgi:hypothetical protein
MHMTHGCTRMHLTSWLSLGASGRAATQAMGPDVMSLPCSWGALCTPPSLAARHGCCTARLIHAQRYPWPSLFSTTQPVATCVCLHRHAPFRDYSHCLHHFGYVSVRPPRPRVHQAPRSFSLKSLHPALLCERRAYSGSVYGGGSSCFHINDCVSGHVTHGRVSHPRFNLSLWTDLLARTSSHKRTQRLRLCLALLASAPRFTSQP